MIIEIGDILAFRSDKFITKAIVLGQRIKRFKRPDLVHLAISLGGNKILEAIQGKGLVVRELSDDEYYEVYRPNQLINKEAMLRVIEVVRLRFRTKNVYDVSAIIGMFLRLLHIPSRWLFDDGEVICSELCDICYGYYNASVLQIYSAYHIHYWPAAIAESDQFTRQY